MKRIISLFLFVFICATNTNAQTDSVNPVFRVYDTVIINAFGRQLYKNIPYTIQGVNIGSFARAPRLQWMNQLTQLPSVSAIGSGNGINKPVIRGLSFNHVQLFAQGVRIDNQSWDDRHDVGISENGFSSVEVVSGPAALLYGPNTMGGAIILHDKLPAPGTQKGYAQLAFHGNTQGIDLKAGYQQGKEKFYYAADATVQVHANYVQGKAGEKEPATEPAEEEDKPLAFNSKFTNVAFKGLIGIRSESSTHEFSYNLYRQQLGIVEDESLEAINNPTKKEERDYEMEAPFQDVTTHVLSTKNSYRKGTHSWQINGGYQFNDRKEYEPGANPKSKVLGVGLKLQTITADVQYTNKWADGFSVTAGAQAFFQNNQNTGNLVLVPDAKVSTIGAYALGRYDLPKWNFLAGIRVDYHPLDMNTTPSKQLDTFNPPILRPVQDITRSYTPFSLNAGLVFHSSDIISVKLNLANGYAAPNYAQLTAFGRHEGTYRFEVGDNSLSMERNFEVDLGVVADGKSFTASVNVYNNSISNYVYIDPTADSVKELRIYRWKQHDAVIRGLEFDLQWHPQNLHWIDGFARAGFIRGRLTDHAGDLPYIPATKFTAGLTFKKEAIRRWLNPYVAIQGSAYGSQEHVSAYEAGTEGYFLADIYAGATAPFGRKDRWNLTAFCANLFNRAYYNHLSLIKTIGVRDPGRNIGFQIRYNF